MTSLLKRYWVLITIVCIAAIAGAVLYTRSVSASTATVKKITTYSVTRKDLKETLTLSGEINAEEKASLRFATSGRLAWVGVKTGDIVKKYQVLASLDQRELKKNLEKKLNTYLSTRWDFEQTKDDKTETADVGLTQDVRDAAKRILDKSQFGLNNSVLDVELQSLTLEYANLWTPIDGVVTNIDTPFAGINITPATAEFAVINPQTIYVSVNADQTEVINLKVGQTAEIVLDSFPEATLSGTISNISFTPKAGETGTVYEMKVAIPTVNEDMRYRIGMTADVFFTLKDKPNTLSVPTMSIKEDNGKPYVFRLNKGNKEKTFIEIGGEYDADTEVRAGLSEGDVVYD
jgi:RND family efflux transporter MFP subunit